MNSKVIPFRAPKKAKKPKPKFTIGHIYQVFDAYGNMGIMFIYPEAPRYRIIYWKDDDHEFEEIAFDEWEEDFNIDGFGLLVKDLTKIHNTMK